MTMTPSFTVTTILTPRGDRPRRLTSFDFTGSGISTLEQIALQSLIDQAIERWWISLTRFRRFALAVPPESSKISASCPPKSPKES